MSRTLRRPRRRGRLERWFDVAWAIAMVVILALVTMAYLSGRQACTDAGGDYVRGAIWYVCVGGTR